LLQCVELNCGRIEARAIDAFDVCSEQVCFPYANKAAMLMQRTDPGNVISSCRLQIIGKNYRQGHLRMPEQW